MKRYIINTYKYIQYLHNVQHIGITITIDITSEFWLVLQLIPIQTIAKINIIRPKNYF